ncbi:C-type lectin domain family 2 member B-like [Sphaerodactylus townsendi]|uniref:Uncharacterized protein n=1 Tax=Sphaerodactylus townsendi TaxID=933632 RepID=A0ACB8EH52_9SAUR|nr:C-type lectin domain family 2 member B-like [Sphaerodactylus townsendi]
MLRIVLCLHILACLKITVAFGSSPGKVLERESVQCHSDADVPEVCGPACPTRWLSYEGKCYFFSEEERDWASSQSFCASHGSSLAVIETEVEKAFILRFGCSPDHWIGLRKEPDQTWKWIDGTELNNMLEVKGEDGDCAFLNSDSAVSSHCHSTRRWSCSHPYIHARKKSCWVTK